MKEILQNAKDFKIIPYNFKSSAEITIKSVDKNTITVELSLDNENELNDYNIGESVEIFGVNQTGLIYFETKILNKNNKTIVLNTTQDYSLIQRREYSRVKLENGKIIFKDMPSDMYLKIEDISAGGIKFTTDERLSEDKQYDIEIKLSGNMKIECALQPIRIEEGKDNKYTISGKFMNLENIDRIVLIQYVFKKKMEKQDIKLEDNE